MNFRILVYLAGPVATFAARAALEFVRQGFPGHSFVSGRNAGVFDGTVEKDGKEFPHTVVLTPGIPEEVSAAIRRAYEDAAPRTKILEVPEDEFPEAIKSANSSIANLFGVPFGGSPVLTSSGGGGQIPPAQPEADLGDGPPALTGTDGGGGAVPNPGPSPEIFASGQAHELAQSMGLAADFFADKEGTGSDGKFTAGDVRTLAAER